VGGLLGKFHLKGTGRLSSWHELRREAQSDGPRVDAQDLDAAKDTRADPITKTQSGFGTVTQVLRFKDEQSKDADVDGPSAADPEQSPPECKVATLPRPQRPSKEIASEERFEVRELAHSQGLDLGHTILTSAKRTSRVDAVDFPTPKTGVGSDCRPSELLEPVVQASFAKPSESFSSFGH